MDYHNIFYNIYLYNILAAVSYTHLDVYKRQAQESALESGGGREQAGQHVMSIHIKALYTRRQHKNFI